MKTFRSIFSFAFFALFIAAGMPVELDAQDARRDATVAYNNARELAGMGEFLQAIESYRESLAIARSSECTECEDIAELVENQLPRVYFSRASNAFEEFRSERSAAAADEAIDYFGEAAEAGQEYGNEQVAQRATAVIPQIYYNKSLIQYNQGDHSAALASLDRAIELNGNYTLAYYQRGIVLVNSDASLEDVVDAFDQAIEVGGRVGDSQNVTRARNRAGSELLYRAVQHIEANRQGQAVQLLSRAENYIPQNADLHYRFAEVYNNRSEYSRAVEHASRALELEGGGVADRAKIYFELGMAYKALEQVNNACSAFEDAAYGDFRDPAMHELEHELECEGFTARSR